MRSLSLTANHLAGVGTGTGLACGGIETTGLGPVLACSVAIPILEYRNYMHTSMDM